MGVKSGSQIWESYLGAEFGSQIWMSNLGAKFGSITFIKMKSWLEGENMQTQYNVLGFGINFYLHDYKLVIKIDQEK